MNKNLKQIFYLTVYFVVIAFFILPYSVIAAEGTAGQGIEGTAGQGRIMDPITIGNPFKCTAGSNCTLVGLLEAIINKILLPIGGLVAAVMIIYAGFLYVTAGGNETQIKKAHDALLSAVIGAAILLGAWVISNAIAATIRQLGGQV